MDIEHARALHRKAVERLKSLLLQDDVASSAPWRTEQGMIYGGRGFFDEVLLPADVDCASFCLGGSSRIAVSEADLELMVSMRNAMPLLATALLSLVEAHYPRSGLRNVYCEVCGPHDYIDCPVMEQFFVEAGLA